MQAIRITRRCATWEQVRTVQRAFKALGVKSAEVTAHGAWESASDGESIFPSSVGLQVVGRTRTGQVRAKVDGEVDVIVPANVSGTRREHATFEVAGWLPEYVNLAGF